MNIRTLAAGLALALVATPALAADLSAADVQAKLRAAGYTQVHQLEREDGLWEADVSRADGSVDEVIIDPANGEIFDPRGNRSVLDAGQILALAQKAGYTRIESFEREGATWALEARNARNQRVEVRLSGYDGRVLSSKRDGWFD
ncbi:PepSY domain-containing protein [Stenotrophomonas rhizophila]|uniref:PepSY domain-containing protein n=1 Tax=Stenotrophomonas rhizophila TaxID=216778 RepID=UPI001E5CD756|nr:PepSY domain-containing protein [Stenotrophomonas rhizophila]MCC7634202.1 PepSY domain-containing protein [Stenotrophomonas rhizophila]MCC7665291.1 PepSY domain-containing protein [Stenotrophomonas rhizophila]